MKAPIRSVILAVCLVALAAVIGLVGRAGVSVSSLASGEPDAQSVLAAMIPVQDVELTIDRVTIMIAVTIVLLLLVGVPTHLLGGVLVDTRRLGRAVRVPSAWWRKLTGPLLQPESTGWVTIAVGMTAAAIIAGFVDQGFGFNPGSLRLLASIAVAFVILNLVGSWLVRRALRLTDPGLDPAIRFRFGALPALVVAVFVSRLAGFEPGMVLGLLVGLGFGVELAGERRARVVLVGAGYAFGLSIVGWLGYSMVSSIAGSDPGWWGAFACETLVALAVSGIAALPIALLPTFFADGGAVFAWRKRTWAVAYGIALFAFFAILLPLPSRWDDISAPLATWIGLYVAYAVVALAAWAWLRLTEHGRAPAAAAADSVTDD